MLTSLLLVFLPVLVAPAEPAATDAMPVIEPFRLQDTSGRWHEFTSPSGGRGTAVLFLGTECPLVRLYAPRMAELARQCAVGNVRFLGIDSNVQDTAAEVAAFARELDLPFPVLLDPDGVVASSFRAERTPEIFLLDRVGQVCYRGRIDDQFEVGIQRTAPKARDFEVALEQFLRGDAIAVPQTSAVGCRIGRKPSPSNSAVVTWSHPIASILQRHCQRCHHEGEIAPFSLTRYEDAVAWGETMAEAIEAGRMPPWHANPQYGVFANDCRLNDEDRQAILAWVNAGCPEGDPSKAPAPVEFPADWQIGTPDQILAINDQPFQVPASGTVEYQWFHVDPGYTEDKWVVASEVHPQARRAVHHATVYFHPPGKPWDLRLNDRIDLLGGYNPGGGPWQAPAGMAMKIPAGSKIVFEMHYTPTGQVENDRTLLGLKFVDPQTVRREVHSVMPANTRLAIPPGASHYEAQTGFVLPADSLLLIMRPHMHLRGKSFRYEALFPDGNREILLDVPRYDFNWQHSYVLKEPKRLPLGTEIRCTATFDNSAANPANPDPDALVEWGDQSWQEMMIGILSIAFVEENRSAASAADTVSARHSKGILAIGSMAIVLLGVLLLMTRRRRWSVALFLCAMAGSAPAVRADTSPDEIIGKPITAFRAVDVYGKTWTADSLPKDRRLVIAFLGVECPLCKLYAPRLSELAQQYNGLGVDFIGMDSNQQDSLADIRHFADQQSLGFPFLKDTGNAVADQFGAERTPQVFLLDTDGTVRYHGRIDDQFYPGMQRPNATRADLQAAIEELLAGEPISLPITPPAGCLIGRAKTPKKDSPITWSGQVASILQQRCQQCHRPGQIGPFALLDYSEAVGWAEMIGEVIRDGRMPPWHASPDYGHFANDIRLSPEEKETLLTWVANGAPEGDPTKAPSPREFTDGWQIETPDEIHWMRDTPFEVPAEGILDYQYFTMDPGWTEDRWIQAVECRAGNRSVVHHMAVFLWLPGMEWIDSFKHFLSGNAQGWGHMVFPKGTARFVPAGTRLVFVMHYAPNGTAQTDRSYMGVKFADAASVTQSCRTVVAVADDFRIPPGVSDYRIEAAYQLNSDAWLISLFPHMHLRGKSFRYTAEYPSGDREILLDIPRYDFGWQENYELAERKFLPKGTVVQCLATYDNSADNRQNPDPTATVSWGFQSSDEMLDGHMQIATAVADDPLVANRPSPYGKAAAALAGFFLVCVLVAPLWKQPGSSASTKAPARHLGIRDNLRAAVAVIVLTAVPVWLLLDHYVQQESGWKPESIPMEMAFLATVWLLLASLVGLFSFTAGRAWFSRRLPHVVLFSVSLWTAVASADKLAHWTDPIPAFHRRSPHAQYDFRPAANLFPGTAAVAACSFNQDGLRGPDLPAREEVTRILCLGGSTTECLYVDDSSCWPAQLAQQLNREKPDSAWVGAAAVSEAGTGHHVRALTSGSLPDGIDQVICLAGATDLMRLIHGQDTGEIAPPLWYESWIATRLRELWNVRLGKARILADPTGEFYAHQRRFLPIHPPLEPFSMDDALSGYGKRIRHMISQAKAQGVELLFVTQPVLWDDDLSADAKRRLIVGRIFPAGREWDLLTPENLRKLMDRFNSKLQETCAETHVECIDAASELSGDESLFLDDFHLNDAGCQRLAEVIAKHRQQP